MIHPISSNDSHTVGLCTCNNKKDDFIGKFKPSLLKEWAEWAIAAFGDEFVYVYSHRPEETTVTARVLTASAKHGDEIQVCLVGGDCDDIFEHKGALK